MHVAMMPLPAIGSSSLLALKIAVAAADLLVAPLSCTNRLEGFLRL